MFIQPAYVLHLQDASAHALALELAERETRRMQAEAEAAAAAAAQAAAEAEERRRLESERLAREAAARGASAASGAARGRGRGAVRGTRGTGVMRGRGTGECAYEKLAHLVLPTHIRSRSWLPYEQSTCDVHPGRFGSIFQAVSFSWIALLSQELTESVSHYISKQCL